jgi:hypothetical protein
VGAAERAASVDRERFDDRRAAEWKAGHAHDVNLVDAASVKTPVSSSPIV